MKITLESTTKIVEIRLPGGASMPARIWEGTTGTGILVHAYVTRLAVARGADASQFEAELQVCREPSPDVGAIAARLIL